MVDRSDGKNVQSLPENVQAFLEVLAEIVADRVLDDLRTGRLAAAGAASETSADG